VPDYINKNTPKRSRVHNSNPSQNHAFCCCSACSRRRRFHQNNIAPAIIDRPKPSPKTKPRASAISARCDNVCGDFDEEGDAELEVVLWGVNVGSVIEGGRVIVGRNEAVEPGSLTVRVIEPISSCVVPWPGIKVIVRVVRSLSTRLTIATRPALESINREAVTEAEETVKLALALEATEVDMNNADARNAINIWGTMSAPLAAGPVVDTTGIPAMLVSFQAP